MKVLMLSKACLVGAYQRKLEAIATHPDVELTVVVPPEWRDERGVLRLEREHTRGYQLVVEPISFNGNFHLHYYPRLGRRIAETQPDVVHIDEEPYNFATLHALRLAKRHGAKTLFFSWQNLARQYPFPFNWMERAVLNSADFAILGSHQAVEVWRAKGYRGPAAVIPQFGVDPDIFAPRPSPGPEREFTVGYAGRFVEEKGIDLLLRAVVELEAPARLSLLGAGPARANLEKLARELNLGERVRFDDWIPSAQLPAYLLQLDTLVVPSRSRPNWKEQFGRVLIEAMACGVPVVGSTCGEIPNVIGDAGLIFPEEDVAALTAHLRALKGDAALRASFAERGRARVLAHYTQAQIAAQTVEVYRKVVAG
ncbi:MAG: glycosyltransferase family 4 protein [Chloroflexi bacterium]|nr:glycosyltransferase family 4 protein [Chloroflexota bacterium]